MKSTAHSHPQRTAQQATQHYRIARIKAGQGSALTLLDLPQGATLSDGRRQVQIQQDGTSLDISRWQHDALSLTLPAHTSPPAALRLLALTRQGGQAGLAGRAGQSNQSGQIRRSTHTLALLPTASPSAAVKPTLSQSASVKPAPATLQLSGLPQGASLTDGLHRLESRDEAQVHSLSGWQLDQLTLRPSKGRHAALQLRIEVGDMSEAERAALGHQLKLRLASPNAYLVPEAAEPSHPSLPRMEIVVGPLHTQQDAGHGKVRIHAQPAKGSGWGRGSAATLATDQHARLHGVKVLEDDELAALERKLRG